MKSPTRSRPKPPRPRAPGAVEVFGLPLSRRVTAEVARYAEEHDLMPRSAIAELLERWNESFPGGPA